MPKISEKKFEDVREVVLDTLEDIVTTIGIMRAHVKVARTKEDLYKAVKPLKDAVSPGHEATADMDLEFSRKD